jgi:hypothetical protein
MTFLEIIQDQSTNLPIQYSGSFREMIREKIQNFGKMIDDSHDLSASIEGIEFKFHIFKKRNKILREGILETIDTYYEGNPSKAYEILKKALDDCNIIGYLSKYFEFEPKCNLFRIRICASNYPLTKENLFHIPFHQA